MLLAAKEARFHHYMRYFIIVLLASLLLGGCKVYNQNIMFKTKESIIKDEERINVKLRETEQSYLVQKGDYLEVRLFTNRGEIILYPDRIDSLSVNNRANMVNSQQDPTQQAGGMMGMGMMGMQDGLTYRSDPGTGTRFPLSYPTFLVQQDGYVKLPILKEKVKVDGLSLAEVDSLLESKYTEFYQEPFVRTRYTNKRIFIFKGETATIFFLRNEKMHLLELLSAIGGINNSQRSSNIRIIRGYPKNISVYLVNLRYIKTLTEHNLTIEPNDIVYIEPIRKTFLEILRDVSPIFSVITSAIALSVILSR